MNKTVNSVVVAFHTTAEAMAFEKACARQGIEGRLLPVPRQISSGCGVAWKSQLEWETALHTLIENCKMDVESIGTYAL